MLFNAGQNIPMPAAITSIAGEVAAAVQRVEALGGGAAAGDGCSVILCTRSCQCAYKSKSPTLLGVKFPHSIRG